MKTSNRIRKACALFLAAALLVMQAPVSAFADTVNKITVYVSAYDYTALDAGVTPHSSNGILLDNVKVEVDPSEGIAGALEEAARINGLSSEKKGTAATGYYISSINGLGEFAGGYTMSGWMATINGDYSNFTLKDSDNNAVIKYHFSLEGYGTDINDYWSGTPTINSFTLAGQTIDVSKLTGNGSGTQADPYVITVPVSADTNLSGLQATYTTTLNKHYVKFATEAGLTDISQATDYNNDVKCCLTGIDGTSKTYYTIKAIKAAKPVSVEGISLSASNISMIKGSNTSLTASILPANAANQSISYSSREPSVAEVNAQGIITAKKVGTTVITVTSLDGSNKTASCEVVVKNPTVKLNAKSMQIQKGKTTSALVVTGMDKTDSVLKFKSSNSKVVSVDAKGVLKAKRLGTAKITVTTKYGATATCKVTVQKGEVITKSLKLASAKLNVKKGTKATIAVTRNPINATDKITYTSSNNKIATVDKKGKVTAKKKGTCTVTLKTTNGVTQKVTIKVK